MCGLKGSKANALSNSPTQLRRLRKSMEKHIPRSCKEDQFLIPGGDLRRLGNQWLRKAFDEAKVNRTPREGEVRKVIGQLSNILDICRSDWPTVSIVADRNCGLYDCSFRGKPCYSLDTS